MSSSPIVNRIGRRLARWWWTPVEVLVFHAVSDVYDKSRNERVDWSQTDDFKNHIQLLKMKYTFVSLEEAVQRLSQWKCRKERLAVLTSDDGYASVLGVLPFLEEERIPVTLFVNPKYLDGVSWREGYAEEPQYMTRTQLWELTSPLISVGMHGYEHDDATQQSIAEFEASVEKCMEILQSHPNYIPFFAYTWGRYNNTTQCILQKKGIVPVLVGGTSNYHFSNAIDRRPIDSTYWKKSWKKMNENY